MNPIYTPDNCRFSCPLKWGLSVFWRRAPCQAVWLDDLKSALEPDGIRVLSHRFVHATTSQFAISTQPHVSPERIVQRVKGRLQHLVRNEHPKAFQRNFALRSFGAEQRQIIEAYVAGQLGHHPCADPRFQRFLANIQIGDRCIDLSQPQLSSHGLYWYNLHVAVVHQERWRNSNEALLQRIREMILGTSKKWGWRLSRGGILPDHVHLAMGCPFDAAPDQVACSLLNNLAFVYGLKPVFQFGAYIGTFGEYDDRVVAG